MSNRNPENYKPLFLDKFEEFCLRFPDYTIGEMMHSIVTQLSKKDVVIYSKGDLLNLSDEDIYSGICKAIKEEDE